MHELVLDTSLRDAASQVGLGHEALRKFVNGTTDRPHQRSLRSMGQLYQQRRTRGVAEVRTSAQSAGHLKLLFSPELETALAEVREIFDDWREGRSPSPRALELERWLPQRLREEHAEEAKVARARRRSRK